MTQKENGLIELDHQQVATNPDDYLAGLTSQWLTWVADVESEDYQRIKQLKQAIFFLGQAEQKSFWNLNERMKYPLQKRMAESQGGGKVTQLLQALQKKVGQIKPPKRNIISGLKNTFKLLFSWHQSAFQMWVENYPKHMQDISILVDQLAQLKRQLSRDNVMLLGDKKDLERQVKKLENCFDLLCLMQEKIKHELRHNPKFTVDSKGLIDEEFLPPLQQRLIELQQQLLIARQAVMTLELFIDENESQIRGLEQASYTTTSVIDVTTGIMMVQKGKENLTKINNHNNRMKANIDTKKLKRARQVIGSALDEMEAVRRQSQLSADELNTNHSLVSHIRSADEV